MSGRCGGLHCPGCGDGGPGLAVLAVILIIIGAAAARPVVHPALTGLARS